MEKYNLDKLVKVVINDFYISRWYHFITEKRLFGIITRKEGFYRWPFDEYVGMNAPKDHVIIGNEMFEKPEVILEYQSNHFKKYVFDTYEEAKKFANDLTNDRKWIS